MLAVFNKSVAKIDPAMKNPDSSPVSSTADYFLARKFIQHFPHATTIKFGNPGYLAIDGCPKKRMIEAHEDNFCLFYGNFENTANLKKYLNLAECASDPQIIFEIYKKWKSETAHIVDSPLSEVEGSFAFILYDMTSDYVAIGVGADGKMPLYWGADSDENLVVASFLPMAKEACDRSYAPFPAGCLYTSSHGLMNFKLPLSKLEAVPWTNKKGIICGVTFRTRAEIQGTFHSVCNYPEPKQ